MPNKIIIGWKKKVKLPDWGISSLRAKVDTGAKTSSLHVEDITILPGRKVQFFVVTRRKEPKRRIKVVTHIIRKARVRTCSESTTTRIFVGTRIQIGSVEQHIELNLVDRDNLIHRMLLGRSALEGKFVVDVSRSK